MRTYDEVDRNVAGSVRACADIDPAVGVLSVDYPVQFLDELLAHWYAVGDQVLVIDVAGRHQVAEGATIDLSTSDAAPEPEDIERLLRRHSVVVVTTDPDLPTLLHPWLGHILTAAQVLRTWSGLPRWIVLEDADALLRDPGLPPSALRMADGGYCMVQRAREPNLCRLLLPGSSARHVAP